MTDLKVPIAPAVSKHSVFYRAIHSINIASFICRLHAILDRLVCLPQCSVFFGLIDASSRDLCEYSGRSDIMNA